MMHNIYGCNHNKIYILNKALFDVMSNLKRCHRLINVNRRGACVGFAHTSASRAHLNEII